MECHVTLCDSADLRLRVVSSAPRPSDTEAERTVVCTTCIHKLNGVAAIYNSSRDVRGILNIGVNYIV